jgi:hypothetical protein
MISIKKTKPTSSIERLMIRILIIIIIITRKSIKVKQVIDPKGQKIKINYI